MRANARIFSNATKPSNLTQTAKLPASGAVKHKALLSCRYTYMLVREGNAKIRTVDMYEYVLVHEGNASIRTADMRP